MAQRKRRPQLLIEDATLLPGAFMNFAGEERQFNLPGNRNFHLVIPPELVEDMVADGWNVKFLKPRDEGDSETAHINVTVSYRGNRPPSLVLIKGGTQVSLDQEQAAIIDWIDIEKVDVMINPSFWEARDNSGRSGIKAYLDQIYITVRESALEQKYAHIPKAIETSESDQEVEAIEVGNEPLQIAPPSAPWE